MNRRTQLSNLTVAIILAGALSGCAAYMKCGFDGCPGDAEITANVRALFSQHPVLEPPNLLNVQTLDHVVYLYGLVDTDFEREIAESVALQAPGVASVVNSIGLSGNR
ncbi:MAG: BON domain-containing protein [Steroidobacteraceae bacterium]